MKLGDRPIPPLDQATKEQTSVLRWVFASSTHLSIAAPSLERKGTNLIYPIQHSCFTAIRICPTFAQATSTSKKSYRPTKKRILSTLKARTTEAFILCRVETRFCNANIYTEVIKSQHMYYSGSLLQDKRSITVSLIMQRDGV